ncbi:MAG: ABC transporter permease [Phyllobacteriaceae bacterium]|nr:ABC transporter permease [Phyllobacteriaceae bacterium]
MRPAVPLGLFYAAFLAAPILVLFVLSLAANETFDRFDLGRYAGFFGERINWIVLVDTLRLGVISTIVCLCLGFPLALVHARLSPRGKAVLIFLVVLPQLTSSVVRTFAWVVILGRQGIVDGTLVALGLPPAGLLYTMPGVVLALAQIDLPLMVLPLIGALGRQDPHLKEASTVLGAGPWRTFFKVTLPLGLPAVYAGSLLVFTSSISAFVTQSIIGGGRLTFMPKYIYDLSSSTHTWPFAAAAVIVLLSTVLLAVTAFGLLGQASLRRAGA